MTKAAIGLSSVLNHSRRNNSRKTSSNSKMAQLLARFEKFTLPKRGQEVTGIVTQILPDKILVDFGGKSEGVIAGKEFENIKKTESIPSIGEDIAAVVVNPEDETGQTVLSIRGRFQDFVWERLEKLVAEHSEIEAEVKDLAKTGILIEVIGIRGFIPASFANPAILKNPSQIKGQKIKVTPIEVDKVSNRLICTTISQDKKPTKDLTKKFKIGGKYTGTVATTLPFGLVINFDNLSSFVPNFQISWEKMDNPQEFFKVGQSVDFVFLGNDKFGVNPQISIKLSTPDPWERIGELYAKDSQVLGTISRISDFGAVVTFDGGVEGLIHISKIPPDLQLTVGYKVSCTVDSIDLAQRRISLSLVLKEKPIGYR